MLVSCLCRKLSQEDLISFLSDSREYPCPQNGNRISCCRNWKFLYPYARLDLCSVGHFCCSSLPFAAFPIWIITFQKFRLEEKRMAYNNGRENRKWLIWKEAEEKILREHGVDETTTPQIRTDDRADFNSNRRFYHCTSNFGEYL